MRHFYRTLPSFSAVAAGQTANVIIPRGPTYRGILLNYKKAGVDATEAQMKTDLTGIRVKIDGRVMWTGNATDILTLWKYMGFAVQSGFLPIWFASPTARTPLVEELLAWGTADVDVLGLEVDIAAAAGAVTLTGDAWFVDESRDLGAIIQRQILSYSAAAAGTFEIPTLPKSQGDLVALHLQSTHITKTELVVDGVQMLDGVQAGLLYSYGLTGRVPQTGWVHYEPTWLDRFEDRLPLLTVQDLRLKLTMDAADTVRIVMDTMLTPKKPVTA